MQPDKLDKIRALLVSPVQGERMAARAALARFGASEDDLPRNRPVRGSDEWHEGRRLFHERIDFCLSCLGSPDLTVQEQRTVRMLARTRGCPWDRGAEALFPIWRKLRA